MVLVYIILCYIALYSVIWLHEAGHAVWYQRFGCKESWYRVTVKPWLFFSTPSPVDEEKADALPPKQAIIVAYGGVLVNMIFTLLTLPFLLSVPVTYEWLGFFLWIFCTLHLAEIVSYMFLGNLYLVSDMANIAEADNRLRPVNLLAGTLLLGMYLWIMFRMPDKWAVYIIIFNSLTILGMGVGRILFTVRMKRNSNSSAKG